jgi:hypothetical protein
VYNPDNEMGFIDLGDFAQVARNILEISQKHYRARYELYGETASYTDYAKLISKIGGKTVRVK